MATNDTREPSHLKMIQLPILILTKTLEYYVRFLVCLLKSKIILPNIVHKLIKPSVGVQIL